MILPFLQFFRAYWDDWKGRTQQFMVRQLYNMAGFVHYFKEKIYIMSNLYHDGKKGAVWYKKLLKPQFTLESNPTQIPP